MGIWGLRLRALSERSALWTFATIVPYMTVFMLVLSLSPIRWLTTGLAAALGAGLGLLFATLAVVGRKWGRLPVRPDGQAQVAAYRVIMSGGPVPGELAPAVEWQARMILKRPYWPGLAWTAFGLGIGSSVLGMLVAAVVHDLRQAAWYGVLAVGFTVFIVAFSKTKERRRRAEAARHQALFVMHQAV